ncbi:MAG: Y-family DNA polymerase [Patescibacteria group bacterium]
MSRPPIFALIDCNNFFVSCERLFRPDLRGRPVVVLSSNDGCVISRSNEAKTLGIPMAAPAFKYRDIFKQQGIAQFSANFELYGDISQRITSVLTSITPRTEIYSVDESFLDLSELDIDDYCQWGRAARSRLLREVGIPTSIGIAPTKTLAKLASEHAKQNHELSGVLDLLSSASPTREAYLSNTPSKEIWGIGWRLAPKLRAEGVFNALQLSRLSSRHANQLMGVHGRQLVAELSGQACHALEALGHVRQTIMKGRTFGEDTNQFQVIEAAIASLGAGAAASLRREGLLASSAVVSLNTNRHHPNYQYQRQSIRLNMPTADTGYITAQLAQTAAELFNPQARYHRANILLYDLVSHDALQPDLFGSIDLADHRASQARLQALDTINSRYGQHTVHYAAEDLSSTWRPKRELRSPHYTTDWNELPTIRTARFSTR